MCTEGKCYNQIRTKLHKFAIIFLGKNQLGSFKKPEHHLLYIIL